MMEAVMKSKRMKVEMTPHGDWSKLPLFDRTGWKQVRFADVVHRADGRYDRATANHDIQRWVAGEHIDEGVLHIRRESFTDDALFPPTFRFTFKVGHVLLHSRNPKKVAVAHFDGITGEKLFVLKPKDENVLSKDFLPFVLLSEHFQKWAVENSSGSVNKFLNWSALERYEFALPPLDQQRRIAELLWAVDEVIARNEELIESALTSKKCATEDLMFGRLQSDFVPFSRVESFRPPRGWYMAVARDLVSSPITKGATPSEALSSNSTDIPFIKITHLSHDGVLDHQKEPVFVERGVHEGPLNRSKVRAGDILLSIVGPPLGKHALIPSTLEEANINQAIAIFRIPDKVIRYYFLQYLKTEHALTWLNNHSKKTSGQQNLTLQVCGDLVIPMPPPNELKKLVALLRQYDRSMEAIQAHQRSSISLRGSLLMSLFA